MFRRGPTRRRLAGDRVGARDNRHRRCVRAIVDAAGEARHGLFECLAGAGICGRRAAACRAGSIVETHDYPGQDHGGAVNASLVDSLPFVRKLFAHERVTGNCETLKPPPVGN